jgi:copper resistance protein D
MAAARFAVYSSLALIFGVGAFTTVLARDRVACEIASGLRFLSDGSLALFVVGTLVWLPLEAAQISSAWHGALQPTTLQTLLSATTLGTRWIERTAVCLLLVAVRLVLPGRPGRQIMFLLSAGSLVSLVLVGHAAMHEGWLGDLHEANDAVHILCASGWIGCLVALVPCLNMLDDPQLRRGAGAALIRFSMVGHVAVALVLLTGVANTYLILGRWPIHLASVYQLLLVSKVTLAVGMVALALVNRYTVVPRLRVSGTAAIADLRRLIFIQLALASGLLVLVSLFGILDPM